jgi:hypothetical protein
MLALNQHKNCINQENQRPIFYHGISDYLCSNNKWRNYTPLIQGMTDQPCNFVFIVQPMVGGI